jgi:hypothetical protein
MKLRRATRSGRWPAAKKPPQLFAHNAVRIERVPIQDLRLNANNSRLHPKKQIVKLARAIKKFGFLNPALIDPGNIIIAGHARVEAAKTLGLPEVPCIRASHLSEGQKRAFAILDNRLTEDATWDFQLLAKELEFLQVEGIDLQSTGFEIPECEMIFAAADTPQTLQKMTRSRSFSPPAPSPSRMTYGSLASIASPVLMPADRSRSRCCCLVLRRIWSSWMCHTT